MAGLWRGLPSSFARLPSTTFAIAEKASSIAARFESKASSRFASASSVSSSRCVSRATIASVSAVALAAASSLSSSGSTFGGLNFKW